MICWKQKLCQVHSLALLQVPIFHFQSRQSHLIMDFMILYPQLPRFFYLFNISPYLLLFNWSFKYFSEQRSWAVARTNELPPLLSFSQLIWLLGFSFAILPCKWFLKYKKRKKDTLHVIRFTSAMNMQKHMIKERLWFLMCPCGTITNKKMNVLFFSFELKF